MSIKAEHKSVEVIQEAVGRWSTDIAMGWEAGLMGKVRRGGKLFNRHPPDHFYESQNIGRLQDWELGFSRAKTYKALHLGKALHYCGKNSSGEVKGSYKGWGVKRSVVVSRLEREGCCGTVDFYYFEAGKIVRHVQCGI